MKGSRFAGPADSPGFLLWRTTNAWQRAVRAALGPLDLTHVQFVLLAVLTWLDDGSTSQRRLAAQAGLDEMMTSQVVRSLEARGLLTRGRDMADGRIRTLAVTARGRELATEAVQVVESADGRFFAGLGDDEPAFLAALRVLDDS